MNFSCNGSDIMFKCYLLDQELHTEFCMEAEFLCCLFSYITYCSCMNIGIIEMKHTVLQYSRLSDEQSYQRFSLSKAEVGNV